MQYIRINKKEAFKLFSEKKRIYFLPCKARINTPWNLECPIILNQDLIDSAKRYKKHHKNNTEYSHMWKGSIEKTAWSLIYNNWKYYNTCYELGYYAHYYKAIE